MNDAALLQRFIKHGSNEAFSTLVEVHWQHVYRACQRRCVYSSDADEACQAVFIALAQKPKRCPPQAILPWLLRVAKYVCIDMNRSRQRRDKHEQAAAQAQRQKKVDAAEQSNDEWDQIKYLLDDSIDALPAKQRDAIIAHYFEGKTYKDIAKSSNAKASTIQMRIKAGLEKLKTQFAKRGVAVSVLTLTGLFQNQIHAAVASQSISASSICTASLSAIGSASGSVAIASAQHALDALMWLKIKLFGIAVITATACASAGIVAIQSIGYHYAKPVNAFLEEPVLGLEIPKIIRFGDTITAKVHCEGFNPDHLLRCDVHWFDKNGKRREKYLHSPFEQRVESDGSKEFSFTIDKHKDEIDIIFVVAYVCVSDWDDVVKQVTSQEITIKR